jgi:hypothetical protein
VIHHYFNETGIAGNKEIRKFIYDLHVHMSEKPKVFKTNVIDCGKYSYCNI